MKHFLVEKWLNPYMYLVVYTQFVIIVAFHG